ncbi:MAG: putative toxin-antitoxin system toxin component, PIN family [candidate division NC10 bacterium]
MRRAVLDTNVVVSALLHPDRVCARLLRLVVTDAVEACVDHRILTEYAEVLTDPRFTQYIPPDRVATVLARFQQSGTSVVAQPLAVVLPDPDDLCFLEVAASGRADLVTGNRRHFPKDLTGSVPVFSPAEYLEDLRTSP